jgi:quinol monooxygenase YgiN
MGLTSMTVALTVEPTAREEIIAVLRSMVGATRAEPGCLKVELSRDVWDAQILYYREEWSSEDHLRRHLDTPVFGKLLTCLETASAPPEIRFDRIATRRGLDYITDLRDAAGEIGA